MAIRKQRFVAFSLLFLRILSLAQVAAQNANSTKDDDPEKEREEISANLFSDLGPLLALFGEQVAKQFMSESMGWADNIIFAMGPLGLITAMIGAIRVAGPTWLKAIIGRARESTGEAEVELMSSTSSNVCELWNGQAIVRVMGSPEITELCLRKLDMAQNTPVEDLRKGERAKYNGRLRRRFGPALRQLPVKNDVEQGSSGLQSSATSQEDESKVVILSSPGHKVHPKNTKSADMQEAPNISLNATRSTVSKLELWTVACVGTMLQLGTIVFCGLTTYWKPDKFKKPGGESVVSYAYPLTTIGTISIVIGMLICAHIIEYSTQEQQVSLLPSNKDKWQTRVFWVQKQTKVSDQDFNSYVIFGRGPRSYVSTSRQRQGTNHETLTVIGALLSVAGFVTQFMGLRNMHWSATIAQLIVTAIMTTLRAWVRRRLVGRPISQKLPDGFELEWLASRHVSLWDHLELQELGKRDDTGTDAHAELLARHNTGFTSIEKRSAMFWSEDCMRNWIVVTGTLIEDSLGFLTKFDELTEGSGAHRMMKVREKLGILTQWEGPMYQSAETVARAIKIVMDTLFADTQEMNSAQKVFWRVKVMVPGDEDKSNIEDVYLTLSRNLNNGQWSASISEIEAVLSLWLYSLKDIEASSISAVMEATKPDESMIKKETDIWLQNTSIRLLGPSTVSARRDYRWWMSAHVAEDIIKVSEREGLEEQFTQIDRYRMVGFRDVGGVDAILNNLSSVAEFKTTPLEAVDGVGVGAFSNTSTGNVQTTLAIINHISMEEMCAHELFASFMWAVANSMTEKISPDRDIIEKEGRPRMLNGVMEYPFNLRSSVLHEMATAVEETGLGTIGEIYACMIPPLSHCNLLPDVSALVYWAKEQARPHEVLGRYLEAGDYYLWLFQIGITFSELKQNKLVIKATAVLVDFYRRVNRTVILWRTQGRIRTSYKEMKGLRDKVRDALIKHADSEVMRNLAKLYHLQMRLPEFGEMDMELWKLQESELQPGKANKDCLAARYLRYKETHSRARFLSKWSTVRPTDSDGLKGDALKWTPLHYVTINETENATEFLHRKWGGNVGACDLAEWTPLHHAAWQGNVNSANTLLQLGAVADAQCRDGMTPLHCCGAQGHVEVLRALIEVGANCEIQDNRRRTALHWGAYTGSVDIVTALLDKGAYIRARDEYGRTPLHYAVFGGLAVYQALINRFSTTATSDAYGRRSAQDRQNFLDLKDRAGQTALHLAAKKGVRDMIIVLRTAYASCTAKDLDGRTPLHLLAAEAENGHEILPGLLRQSSEWRGTIELMDKAGRTPIHLAAMNGRKEIVAVLLDNGADFHKKDYDGRSILHLAAKEGRQEVVELLLARGALSQINLTDQKSGRTPLQLAIFARHHEVVGSLLDNGANLESRDLDGRTALHWSAEAGITKAVEQLIERSADLEAKDSRFGRTALHFAAGAGKMEVAAGRLHKQWTTAAGRPEVAKLLLDAGAVIDARDDTYGRTALNWACIAGIIDIIKLLLERGQPVDQRDNTFSRTNLHLAARAGLYDVCEFLLDNGADIDAEDEDGRTALHWAIEAGRTNVVELLRQRGSKANAKEFYAMTKEERAAIQPRRTSLHWAAMARNTELLSLLLSRGASIESTDDRDGKTALHWSAGAGYLEVIDVLLKNGASALTKDERHARTALHWAVISGQRGTVEKLLDWVDNAGQLEALMAAKDLTGRTAMEWAEEAEEMEIAEVLKEAMD